MIRQIAGLGLGQIAALTGLALMLVACRATPIGATSFSWNVNTAGAFNDAANWAQTGPIDFDGVPDANDIVTFRRGSGATYTVTFPGVGTGTTPVDYVTDRLLVGSNTTSFAKTQFNPAPSTYTAENATTAESGRAIIIGVLGGDSAAVLNTRLPTFSGAAATIGDAAGSSGTLNVNAGTFSISGSSTMDDELIIGNHGTGALNVNTGAAVTLTGPNGDTVLGKYALSSGTATVSGSGSTWSAGSNLTIASGGGGALSVAGGGHVNSQLGYLGYGAGSNGTATIDGIGSAWTLNSGLHIGETGSAAMSVTAGGHVASQLGYLGYGAGSNGTATVTGPGSSWDVGGALIVGNYGVGVLNVTAGGHVTSVIGEIGYQPGSSGTVTVDGNNSKWTNTILAVGSGGNGVLHITGGGRVDDGDSNVGYDGSGVVVVDGASSLWYNSGNLSVGVSTMGTLTASNGAAINSAAFTVGGAAEGTVQLTNAQLSTSGIASIGEASVGTVTLAAGSHWELNPSGSSPNFAVGNYGSGTLNVLSASTVRILGQAMPELGNQPLAHGTVNVDGAGSEFFVESQDLSVGRFGNGVFNITGGGRVTAPNFVFLGENAASQGDVLVQDIGSIMTALEIDVAHNGMGSLTVEAGGGATAEVVIVAFGMGSNGMAVVDGTESYLDVRSGAGQLIVGGGSVGSLSIAGGALAEAREVIIGDGVSSTGTTAVRGAGSRLTAIDEIDVGLSGAGALTVSDGGVAAAPVILINSQSSVHGNGTLQGDVTNHGIVLPGESPGALHIDGNYAQTAAARLKIELAGITPATDYDQLLVTGNVTLGGTLDVLLISPFTPHEGDSFNILGFASLSGVFATLNLPALTASLQWNTSQLYTYGVLSVGLAGDFNGDGAVNAADYVVWRKGFGTTYTPSDFDVWRAHFGQTAGSGAGATANAAIPEPTTLVLLIMSAFGWCLRRHWAA